MLAHNAMYVFNSILNDYADYKPSHNVEFDGKTNNLKIGRKPHK